MSRKEQGASAVEFAILLPVLILILFGIIEFSLVMYDKAVLTNACREGARTGILQDSPRRSFEDISAAVERYCQNNLVSFSSTTTTTSAPVTCKDPGDIITVSVSYPYTFLFLPNFVDKTVTLSASSAMRCE